MAGVAVMFALNLGVSFVLSLSTAARAYGFSGRDVRTLLAAAARRALRYPGDFLLPPRAGAGQEEVTGAPPADSGPVPRGGDGARGR
jgi:site-specific recombinase